MSEIIILRRGESAGLDPTHSGFAHGYGLFETMRLSAGRLYAWELHWRRLKASAEALGLPCPWDAPAVLAAIQKLVQADSLTEATVKLSLLKTGSASDLYLYTRPSASAPSQPKLLLDRSCPLNEHSPLAGHKTHNYMENLVLLEAARAKGFYDCLRLNSSGQLAETTMANLVVLKDGRWSTPSLSCGVLPGVMRHAWIESVGAEEGSYGPELLTNAEAVLTTNASTGPLPISRVVDRAGQVIFEAEATRSSRVRESQDVVTAWLERTALVL